MVNTHAHSKFVVTPHLTALKRLVAPTPIIEPVMVCVVETGIPICPVKNNVNINPDFPSVEVLTYLPIKFRFGMRNIS